MNKEDGPKLTVRFSDDLHKRMTKYCKIDHRVSFQDFIIACIEHGLKNKVLPEGKK